ncbi:hypothetical protein [Sporosarcina pasteurii]|uniref:Uncharacterized protein n=1 Tax=Sporosarcina pasteurii TaxID=1474 RepID=A0A380CDW6_SPOPA|nr:hypothetical protein [Sporosarcina pasteurii]MDS9473210.1 hypothetical protein [Sporosarcina pasteurii]QBQ06943.1 hypothetical protein E2C16_15465 [Sporosarcina pasteurii]SUJ18424.1 Uncharacterised protein [Sporosarcina pasteurii]
MRKLFLLMGCFVFVVLLSGCDRNVDNAVKFGEEFIKKLYTVDNSDMDVSKMSTEQHIEFQDGFSPYLTTDALQDLSLKRTLITPREVAFALNNTISVQSISLEEGGVQEKGESLYFDHSFTLIFKDEDENKVDEIEIKGQMTIVNTGDGLKVDRYRDDENLMNRLTPIK